MSILNLNGPAGRPARSKRAVKVWMGIGMVIAVLGIGSTLASTITINGGQNTEFGQGVQRTVYCGGTHEITVKPISSYIDSSTANSAGEEGDAEISPSTAPGFFYLSGIAVSDIPDACSGVNFVLSVYSVGGDTPIVISTSSNHEMVTPTVLWKRYDDPAVEDEAKLSSNRNMFVDPRPTQVTVLPGSKLSGPGSFTVNFSKFAINTDINNVGRILIETQDDIFGPDGLAVKASRVRS